MPERCSDQPLKRARAVRRRRQPLRQAASAWHREELGRQAGRALLLLGAGAPELPPDQRRALGLEE